MAWGADTTGKSGGAEIIAAKLSPPSAGDSVSHAAAVEGLWVVQAELLTGDQTEHVGADADGIGRSAVSKRDRNDAVEVH